jgi:K+-transporting ATPase c subunit
MKSVIILSIIFVLVGCEIDLTGFVRFPDKLSDQRFNGKFSYDISGSVYGSGIATYKFDGTNYAVHERFQYYAHGSNLSTTGYEIEISNGRYRERIWENDFSKTWGNWSEYHFDDEGDLWIGTLELKRK